MPGSPADPLPGIGPVFSEKNDSEDGVGVSGELKNISQQQLDKKFKHALDFGVITTKKILIHSINLAQLLNLI